MENINSSTSSQTIWNVNSIFSREDVYNILRQEILTLRIPPGQLLSENQISKRFNLSRTPVRSVFERLIAIGLLEVIPRKGTYVTLIDLDYAEQILFMRIQSEIAVMTYLCRHPDAQLFDKLERNLEQQKAQLDFDVVDEDFFRLDSRFHELCMVSLNKYKLWQMIQNTNVHYFRYRRLDYLATKGYPALYNEHCQLLKSMREGSAKKIREQMTTHLYGGFLRINKRLATEYKKYFSDSERDISQILLDVKLQINEVLSKD